MTEARAKKLCIEMWSYLAKHPEIMHKTDLPDNIFRKVARCYCHCPLCELFGGPKRCCLCPLMEAGEKCSNNGSAYDLWHYSLRRWKRVRREAALKIVAIVKAWKPEE